MTPAETDQSKATPGSAGKMTPMQEKGILSPRFRSVAAMAGWDEESLLACLVVEDTPDRDAKQRKRRFSKSPATGSKRKRKSPRRSPSSVPVVVLSLDEEEDTKEEEGGLSEEKNGGGSEMSTNAAEVPKAEEAGTERVEDTNGKSGPNTASALPCLERLREELSCAICLDICFEPSTTPCGHSFCLKCLRCAASKCGKRCPKCRDLIGNARSCTVNTVLWNTVQLLFPEEVEARRKKKKPTSPKPPPPPTTTEATPPTRHSVVPTTNRSAFILSSELVREAEMARCRRRPSGDGRGRRVSVSQSEDAALALRLQREEFMVGRREQVALQRRSSSVHSARANLRAMASRAIQVRVRTSTFS